MIRTAIQASIRLVPWRLRRIIRHIPGVAPLQRYLLTTTLYGREFSHLIDAGPAKGLYYPVMMPEDKGVWTGNYELDFITALAESVQPGDVCFDIGGWRGYCGGAMACQGAGQVYIFEPLPENCRRIERLCELNPHLPIQLITSAVGASDGTATFKILDSTSMGKLGSSTFQPEAQPSSTLMVNVISLDEWCRRKGVRPPDVVKIDVEGAELMVLRGAERTLRESFPKLFIECHSRELTSGVTQFLEPFGYRAVCLETNVSPDGHSEPEVCHLVATSTPSA